MSLSECRSKRNGALVIVKNRRGSLLGLGHISLKRLSLRQQTLCHHEFHGRLSHQGHRLTNLIKKGECVPYINHPSQTRLNQHHYRLCHKTSVFFSRLETRQSSHVLHHSHY